MGIKFPCGTEICLDWHVGDDLEEAMKNLECPFHGKDCKKVKTET